MYHLPKQTIEDFEQSLDLALDMDIQHIFELRLNT